MTAPYPTDSYARKPFANTLRPSSWSNNETGTHFANLQMGHRISIERLSVLDALLEYLNF